MLGSTEIAVEILGFDYDDLVSGGKAPISFGMVDCFNTKLPMNATNTNVGGWEDSALRTTIIDDVLPAFISAIGANIIKPVSKRTSAGNKSTTINTTTDSLWFMSEYEIFRTTEYSIAGEKPTDIGYCYPAFTNAASRMKKVGGSNTSWWERSPTKNRDSVFCSANTTGNASYFSGASASIGVALGFCV